MKILLVSVRFFEELFYKIGSFFEDYGDSIDVEFHEILRKALAEDQGTMFFVEYQNSGDQLSTIRVESDKL